MPTQRTLKRSINKVRRPYSSNPNFMTIRSIFFMPDIIQYRGSSILIHDSGSEDDDRFLIFSNTQLITFAQSVRNLQMDGTFEFAPKCYYNGTTNTTGQVYTIQGRKDEVVVPLAYVLMNKRTTSEYRRVLDVIQEKLQLNVEKVMLDLELGAISAVGAKYPNAQISLCYYHFQESLYSWLCQHGMKIRYSNDDEFRFCIHLHSAIAFAAPERVLEAWTAVQTYISEVFPVDQDIEDFTGYFETSFIGRLRPNNVRGNARYDKSKWNQHGNVISNCPRTNNAVEGWHNALNHISSASHPNVYPFVKIIKKDMDNSRIKIIQYESGHESQPRKTTYRKFDERVRNAVIRADNDTMLEYMKKIARMMHFY